MVSRICFCKYRRKIPKFLNLNYDIYVEMTNKSKKGQNNNNKFHDLP